MDTLTKYHRELEEYHAQDPLALQIVRGVFLNLARLERDGIVISPDALAAIYAAIKRGAPKSEKSLIRWNSLGESFNKSKYWIYYLIITRKMYRQAIIGQGGNGTITIREFRFIAKTLGVSALCESCIPSPPFAPTPDDMPEEIAFPDEIARDYDE